MEKFIDKRENKVLPLTDESDTERIVRLERFMKESRDMLAVISDSVEALIEAAKNHPAKHRRSLDRKLRRSGSFASNQQRTRRSSSDSSEKAPGAKYSAPTSGLARVISLSRKSVQIDLSSVAMWSHAAVVIQRHARKVIRKRRARTDLTLLSLDEPRDAKVGAGCGGGGGGGSALSSSSEPRGQVVPSTGRVRAPSPTNTLANSLFGDLDTPASLPTFAKLPASSVAPEPLFPNSTANPNQPQRLGLLDPLGNPPVLPRRLSALDVTSAASTNGETSQTLGERARSFFRLSSSARVSGEGRDDKNFKDGPSSPEGPPRLSLGSFSSEGRSADSFRLQSEGYEQALKVKTKMQRQFHVVRSDPGYMLNPKTRFKMTWDLAAVMPLLVYLAVMIPFRLCFDNEPVLFSPAYWFEFTIDLIFICDILLSFRTGYFLNLDEPDLVEYHPWLVATNYLQGWFVFDCVSGIPFALIELLFASNTSNASALKSIKTLRIIRFLKLGRLLKLEKIMSNMDRDVVDRIEDFFSDIQTRSVIVVAGLALKMGYAVHLLSCMWVLVGRTGSLAEHDNWLVHEMKGEFEASDTTGGRHVKSIYLAAYYYTLTTMTSVGYGDIITRNNTERAFTIFLEFVGSFVYAMITAALTSVVTSMDLNARKTAEQLDAVASFVKTRKFPEDLGRRVRRHFRHFYSMKSAIDETKIFNELSTTLRKEVSMYLVSELMGDVELFRNMSPVLLPRLLPLLRPMRFEAGENICIQGEECIEMYVVIVGAMRGTTSMPTQTPNDPSKDVDNFAPRVRRINAGDIVNVLCVLGVWNRCLETVEADVPSESYAITEKDFEGLFSAEADELTFEDMKEHEVHHYVFDEEADNYEARWGKPLYFCCFTALDVCLVRGRDVCAGDVHLTDPFVEMEVVDLTTGKPLSRLWYFKAQTPKKTSPFWNQRVVWQDILAPFNDLALRVSLFDSDFIGADACLGRCVIPFRELASLPPGPEKQSDKFPRLEDLPSELKRKSGSSGRSEGSMGPPRSPIMKRQESIRLQQQIQKLVPLEPGFSEKWWPIDQAPHARSTAARAAASTGGRKSTATSSALAVKSSFDHRHGGKASKSKDCAVQLRTRVRRPVRDPLPSPNRFDEGNPREIEKGGEKSPGFLPHDKGTAK